MKARRVLGQRRCGDAALRAIGRAIARGDEHHASPKAGGFERRGRTGEPIADDEYVCFHSSTMRVIAPRALSATSSGTRTSNTSSRSDVRTFSSVIFFM